LIFTIAKDEGESRGIKGKEDGGQEIRKRKIVRKINTLVVAPSLVLAWLGEAYRQGSLW
jgi:hypothetical protein